MIAIRSLSVSLAGTGILQDLDVDFEKGSRSLIAGENGAGKTTLLRTILGFLPYQQGSITVLGTEVGSNRYRKMRRIVGYVEQERARSDFPSTAFEVASIGACELPIGKQERHDTVLSAMNLAGCGHLAHRPYADLSGGEKQRVAIARCLSQKAEVLLLDEPSSSLDPSAREGILHLIEQLNEENGITILMVCHDERSASRDGWIQYRLTGGAIEVIQ